MSFVFELLLLALRSVLFVVVFGVDVVDVNTFPDSVEADAVSVLTTVLFGFDIMMSLLKLLKAPNF